MRVSALGPVVIAIVGTIGGCDFLAVRNVVIQGRVSDGNGQPLAGLRLYIADLEEGNPFIGPRVGAHAYAYTDTEGRYSFRFRKLHGPVSISVLDVDRHAACPGHAVIGNDAALIDKSSFAGAHEVHKDLVYCDPTPQERALAGALQLAKATQELDIAAIVRATIPDLRSAVGGDENLRKRLEHKLVGDKSHRRDRIESVSIGQPMKMGLDGDTRYIFFPYTLWAHSSGTQYITRAFYLAVSRDSGATWHYADALYYPDDVRLAGIRELVPGYIGDPPLPIVGTSGPPSLDFDFSSDGSYPCGTFACLMGGPQY
jgi:hypothetical protein